MLQANVAFLYRFTKLQLLMDRVLRELSPEDPVTNQYHVDHFPITCGWRPLYINKMQVFTVHVRTHPDYTDG